MEWSLIGFALCFLHQILSGSCSSSSSASGSSEENLKNNDEDNEGDRRGKMPDDTKDPEYAAEKKAGDPADMFGSNQHHNYPTMFSDFGRRFVPVYPYTEKKPSESKEESQVLKQKNENKELIPMKATPEEVLAVAMKSALDQASMSVNHSETVNKEKEILRSGDYWNAIWVEDVDPKSMLRSYSKNQLKQEKQRSYSSSLPKLGSVKAKIMPGSKLYQLVSVLQQFSPRLLYVINSK